MGEKWTDLREYLEQQFGWMASPVKRLLLASIKLGVSFVILIMMLFHLAELIQVDLFVVVLGVTLYLLWFGESLLMRFNRLEGFGVRLDIRHVELLEQRAEGTRFAQPASEDDTDLSERTLRETTPSDADDGDSRFAREVELPTSLQITKSDVGLSLAALRIEIERELIRLAGDDLQGTIGYGGVNRLTKGLVRLGVLTDQEGSIIRDLTGILNSAVHAHPIDETAAGRALEVGVDILQTLRSIRVRHGNGP